MPITETEVTKVVKKLHDARNLAVDEIHLEFLKALSPQRQYHVDIEGSPSGLANWGGFLKKGDQKVSSNYRRITFLNLCGKVYTGVLEKRV